MSIEGILLSGCSCLSPHGESGLKFMPVESPLITVQSLPAWGEWIEIQGQVPDVPVQESLPAWGEWIEI